MQFGVESFADIKNLLQNALDNIRTCESVQNKVFAFVGTIQAFQPNLVPTQGPMED